MHTLDTRRKGLCGDSLKHEVRVVGADDLIMKPFRLTEVARTIRRTLDAR